MQGSVLWAAGEERGQLACELSTGQLSTAEERRGRGSPRAGRRPATEAFLQGTTRARRQLLPRVRGVADLVAHGVSLCQVERLTSAPLRLGCRPDLQGDGRGASRPRNCSAGRKRPGCWLVARMPGKARNRAVEPLKAAR